MLRDRDRADAPLRWLQNARADLALAKVALPPGGLYEHLCFHAQQAVEKGLKAVLLKMRIEFPFTHNLQALFDLVPSELHVPRGISDAVILSPYAVATRYPGESEPVTESDYREAIRLAESVTQWAENVVNSGESNP
jgi:HEPN domain-containing protein